MGCFLIDTWICSASFLFPEVYTEQEIAEWVSEIGQFDPKQLEQFELLKVRSSNGEVGTHWTVWQTYIKARNSVEGCFLVDPLSNPLFSYRLWLDKREVSTDDAAISGGTHLLTVFVRSAENSLIAPKVTFNFAQHFQPSLGITEHAGQGLDVDHLHKVIDLTDGAISPDGKHVAFVSSHWDSEADEFVKRINVLAIHPGNVALTSVWTWQRSSVRTLRFSPDSQFLAFLQSSEDLTREELAVYSLATGQVKTIFSIEADLSYPVWSSSSGGLFFVCDTLSSSKTRKARLIESIPKRLPWWQKQTHIRYVSFHSMEGDKEAGVRISSDMTEISHLCLSPDRNTLAFTEERCDNGTKISLYLHRIDLYTMQTKAILQLPNSFISTPAFSPNSKYLAYVGSRVQGLDGRPVPLNRFADLSVTQRGYGINVYDTRIHLVDLHEETIFQLATDAPLCAGIPTGLAPLHQEIFWRSDRQICFIATQGHQTALADQSIDDDDSLFYQPLGLGSSRCHSFSTDGSCFFFQSEQGHPFVPAIFLGMEKLVMFPNALPNLQSPDLIWHEPESIDGNIVCDAWIYFPEEAKGASGATIPLMVSLYGGASPLCMAFDENQQIFVSRGYAILVVNPSGCGGFGHVLADRLVNDWGTRAVSEIIETIKVVLQTYPVLDSHSIGVYGGSYGGFLAMMLIAHSNMFKAACSIAGISNITSYWGGSRFGYQYGLAGLSDSFPWTQPELFIKQSPIFQVDKIITPLLLLHGECDSVVPLSESEQIFVALKTLERNVWLVVFADEDHGIRGCPSAKLSLRRYLVAWFEKEIKGRSDEWDRLKETDL